MSDAPLTPADCDLRDFPFMPVDIVRLFASEFHAVSTDAGWRAGVTLWLKAWHQVPAASLPDDDIQLARLAEFGRDVEGWREVKAEALHGWCTADNGKLYHPVVAEKALEAWLEKLVQRISSGAGNQKRWGTEFDQAAVEAKIDAAADMLAALAPQSRAISKAKRRHSRKDASGNPGGMQPEVPSRSQGTGTGTGTGKKEEKVPAAPAAVAAYAFQGRIIQLTQSDFEQWQRAYPAIDLSACLQSRDDWLATEADEKTRKRWFIATSNHLANLQQKAAASERQEGGLRVPC